MTRLHHKTITDLSPRKKTAHKCSYHG